jgi:hypothetical protein
VGGGGARPRRRLWPGPRCKTFVVALSRCSGARPSITTARRPPRSLSLTFFFVPTTQTPQVEEISAAESHKKANQKKQDPLEVSEGEGTGVRERARGEKKRGRGRWSRRAAARAQRRVATLSPRPPPPHLSTTKNNNKNNNEQNFCNDNPDADECRVYED